MSIQVGDRLPQATFRIMTPDGAALKTTDELFKGRKVVLVGVPGAFTPTCHGNHLPGFVQRLEDIKAKGIDAVAVTSVNDVFVMSAWSKATGGDGIEFLADGEAEFAKAIGLTLERPGLGTRSQRYSMVVEDGIVRALNVEDTPSKAEASGAENLLQAL